MTQAWIARVEGLIGNGNIPDALAAIDKRVGKNRSRVSDADLDASAGLLARIEAANPADDEAADLARYVELRRLRARGKVPRHLPPIRRTKDSRPLPTPEALMKLRSNALEALRELAELPDATRLRKQVREIQERNPTSYLHQQKGATKRERLMDELRSVESAEEWYEKTAELLAAAVARVDPADWHRMVAAVRTVGSYTVTLAPRTGKRRETLGQDERVRVILVLHGGMTWQVAGETLKRAKHVSPEAIVQDVSLDDAIEVKSDLELCGATAKITEGVAPKADTARDPIPSKVRREVWRRDEGRCVDCGSRERLEYDHIIPVSKGGSNTARNIELRCETCNRRKGATI